MSDISCDELWRSFFLSKEINKRKYFVFSFSTGISTMQNELVILDLERIETEKVNMKQKYFHCVRFIRL